jgi:hypothetical protein
MSPRSTSSPALTIAVTIIADAPRTPAWDALWRRLLAPVPSAPTPLPPKPAGRKPRPRPEKEAAA